MFTNQVIKRLNLQTFVGEKEERGGRSSVQRSGGAEGTFAGKNVWKVRMGNSLFHFKHSDICPGLVMVHQPWTSGKKSLQSTR